MVGTAAHFVGGIGVSNGQAATLGGGQVQIAGTDSHIHASDSCFVGST
jgi:hypothetical protein